MTSAITAELLGGGLAEDLAAASLAMASRFARGATLWCVAPGWEPHAHHMAVEFVHPVIVGKRALPAFALTGSDLVQRARVEVRAGDILVAVAAGRDGVVGDLMRRAPAWGAAFAVGGRLYAFGNGGSSTDCATFAALFAAPPVSTPPAGTRPARSPPACRPLPALNLAADLTVVNGPLGRSRLLLRGPLPVRPPHPGEPGHPRLPPLGGHTAGKAQDSGPLPTSGCTQRSIIRAKPARPGDKVLPSGTLADHGMAVMLACVDLGMEADIRSETAPIGGADEADDALGASAGPGRLRDRRGPGRACGRRRAPQRLRGCPDRGHARGRPAAPDLLRKGRNPWIAGLLNCVIGGLLDCRTAGLRKDSRMCLGIPGQVVEMTDPDAYLAKVDVNGIKRSISVRLLADSGIDIGDWVLVHVGFAMAKIDEREATATLDAVRRMGKAYTDELDAFRSTGGG